MSPVATLRPYQEASLDAICDAFFEKHQNRLLVKKPTGTGKTVTFAALLRWPKLAAWLTVQGGKGAKMLVIAHRDELLTQAQAKIQSANPGLMVAIEQADLVASRYADVVVASIQTLSARKFIRLKRLLQAHDFKIVVVDEAHHAAASTYRTALAHLGFLPTVGTDTGEIEAATHDDVIQMEAALTTWDREAPKDRLLVGVTATPNRTDAIGLGCVFQSLAYSYALKQAIDDGWLVPIVPWVVETGASLDEVRTSHGDFNQKDLAETVNTPERNRIAVEAWAKYAKGRSTLAFTVDVQHAQDLAAAFVQAGIGASYVSGETPTFERRDILKQFSEGRLEMVTNCMVFTEGTDLPRTSCILMAKPTKSPTLFEQCVGRGLRLFPGKENCLVIDVVDIARKHSLQTAPVLYGLPPGLNTQGQDLQQLADALEKLREDVPGFDVDGLLEHGRFTLGELQVRAQTFNVWTIPDLGALTDVCTMQWLKAGADTYRLQYPWADGVEVLSVEPDLLGHFDVVTTLRPTPQRTTFGWAKAAPARQRTVATQISNVAEAIVVAERYVSRERGSVQKLTDRLAPWRGRLASEKQLQLLARLGVPPQRGLTMGRASDLINMAKARKGR